MNCIVFTKARVVDPSQNLDKVTNLVVEGGKVKNIVDVIEEASFPQGTEFFSCEGKVILPGLVDMRCFLGEDEAATDQRLLQLDESAAAGGITTLVLHPDGTMFLDKPEEVALLQDKLQKLCKVKVYLAAGIDKAQSEKELSEYGLLKKAGALALSTGKRTLQHCGFLRKAMLYAQDFSLPLLMETQEPELATQTVIGEGKIATLCGYVGAPKIAEKIALQRDLSLITGINVAYHANQLSCLESLEVLQKEKSQNSKISAGASVYHLFFNEQDLVDYDTSLRFSPPLRSEEDRLGLIDAVRDGLIDVVVSSHDPQSFLKKMVPFPLASCGAPGLKTLLPAMLRLYHEGALALSRIVEVLATRPAQLLGISAGTLQKGADADLLLLDLEKSWACKKGDFFAMTLASPFKGQPFQGAIEATFKKGEKIFQASLVE